MSFIEGHGVTVRETVDAKKERKGEAEARELIEGASKLIAARGKKFVSFDLKKGELDDEALKKHVLGPTGNLRAPALRVGKTWLIGYHEEVYAERLG